VLSASYKGQRSIQRLERAGLKPKLGRIFSENLFYLCVSLRAILDACGAGKKSRAIALK